MLQSSKARLLHDSLRRYLRMRAWDNLARLIDKTRDEDLALVMGGMLVEQQKTIFSRLPNDQRRAGIIAQMQPPFGKTVLDPMPPGEAAAILKEMAADDVADIIADLEEEHASKILEILEAEEIEDLLQYDEQTAGGIMLPDFVALRADNTAEEAIVKLRESDDVEMVYYIYVVDDAGHLAGVLSLRRLVSAPPTSRVRDLMETDVISVKIEDDQEEVARLVDRFGFVAVPVVDDGNKLVGIVTVDDVIDVLRDEATEDILKMVGAGTDLSEMEGVGANLKLRFPWLLATAAGGLVAAAVMGLFPAVREFPFLVQFVPIIIGMSGNVGTQAATVTVRSLALGRIAADGRSWVVVRRELLVGISMGLIYGVLVGAVGAVFSPAGEGPGWYGYLFYGVSIGASLALGMLLANALGTMIPLALDRMRVDPAVATGPLVTTMVDILGIATYFTVASLFADLFGVVAAVSEAAPAAALPH